MIKRDEHWLAIPPLILLSFSPPFPHLTCHSSAGSFADRHVLTAQETFSLSLSLECLLQRSRNQSAGSQIWASGPRLGEVTWWSPGFRAFLVTTPNVTSRCPPGPPRLLHTVKVHFNQTVILKRIIPLELLFRSAWTVKLHVHTPRTV